jgi:3-oxoacyl-[acyl-carrier protein] reductase
MAVNRLESRRALVTGAARGIGRGILERFAAEGARLVAADVDGATLDATTAAVAGTGVEVHSVVADLAQPADITALIARAEDLLGGLDIVVNNAGIQREAPSETMTLDEWQVVLDVDLRAYFLVIQAALPLLQESPYGRIVNISSRAHLGLAGQVNYSAAKAGVIGMTRALSLELGPKGITVNAIAPGMIDTDLVRNNPRADEMIAGALHSTPIGQIGTAGDVAAAVAFLASDDASFVSGEVLHVTGGRY